MTQDIKHTPLPWKLELEDDGYTGISADECWTHFAQVVTTHGEDPESDSSFEGKANAEFIVRACNSHYELLNLVKNGVYLQKEKDEVLAAIAKAEGK